MEPVSPSMACPCFPHHHITCHSPYLLSASTCFCFLPPASFTQLTPPHASPFSQCLLESPAHFHNIHLSCNPLLYILLHLSDLFIYNCIEAWRWTPVTRNHVHWRSEWRRYDAWAQLAHPNKALSSTTIETRWRKFSSCSEVEGIPLLTMMTIHELDRDSFLFFPYISNSTFVWEGVFLISFTQSA